MQFKNIYDPESKTQLENELNKIIYAYVARGQYLLLPSNSETFVKERLGEFHPTLPRNTF